MRLSPLCCAVFCERFGERSSDHPLKIAHSAILGKIELYTESPRIPSAVCVGCSICVDGVTVMQSLQYLRGRCSHTGNQARYQYRRFATSRHRSRYKRR